MCNRLYASEKCPAQFSSAPSDFINDFDFVGKLNTGKALLDQWKSVHLLFQLTSDEIETGSQLMLDFGTEKKIDNTIIESYLFFALELSASYYTRTQLATITREINKLFPMPAMVLFRHGEALTLSIINRRLHKRDESKDVLEKVTLIKDIKFAEPHRAHIEILFDLSLDEVYRQHGFTNFVELHRAWQKVLDSSELNKRFFREIAYWYFWAIQHVTFPKDVGKDEDIRNATSVIRLITRLIFIWFIKEKGLVPDSLFDQRRLKEILNYSDPNGSTYYKAILQNLFFATLNQEMNTPDKPANRKFRSRSKTPGGRDLHYNITNLYRYEGYFQNPSEALELFSQIPFLNGGLFECLDKEDKDDPSRILRIDGFSDRPDNELCVPDLLFFSDEREVNLNKAYGTTNKTYKVRGLIDIFDRYKFTIEENTPIEEEIALDPELLGRVFENLLANYNPETKATARKQTGSYYTPREIVNYMVDESLIAYLETQLKERIPSLNDMDSLTDLLREVFAYTEKGHPFNEDEVVALIDAIDSIRVLDPACGSGAFPMGILHKLVFILGKLDPNNERWKQKQLDKLDSVSMREELERIFQGNNDDYGRKLYLIENCIYGVDIQPIAVQIAKLRFFISLVVDQKIDDTRENRGIIPLPNLETKFVAANTLIGIEKPLKPKLHNPEIDRKEAELAEVRKRHFSARTPKTKNKYRERDTQLRAEISQLLQQEAWPPETAEKLAHWDPYDQNASASFFDPEWMFGIVEGFDVVIANPPYVRQEQIKDLKPQLQKQGYECYTGVVDLYVYFYERGFQLLREGGVLTYISSNKYFRSGYGQKLRRFLGSKSTVHQLIDFGDAPVFEATAYPSIIILSKRPPAANQTRALNWKPGPPIEEFDSVFRANSFLVAQKELTADGWRLESPAVLRLLEKLRKEGKPLGEYVNGRFYRGILTGLNEAFVVDRATRDRLLAEHPSSAEVLKPFLRGRDVKRWRVDFADQYLIKIESSQNKRHPWSDKLQKNAEAVFAETYPAIHARFEGFRNKLMKRDDQGTYFWELRACAYWQEFEQPKIIYPDIAHGPEFAFDDKDYYLTNTLYLLPTEQLWLLGLLNSKVIFWFYTKTSTQIRGGFVRFIAQYVSQIPIPTNTNPKPIETLVDQILAAKCAKPAADVSAMEREIDRLVYDLYGITEQEIEIVEGSSAKDGGGET